MVSKARLDLPEPERPVTTMSLSRGISTEIFLRLCTRAPCTAMVVRAAGWAEGPWAGAVLVFIRIFFPVNKGQFLDNDVALLSEQHGRGSLADQALVGQILTCGSHP